MEPFGQLRSLSNAFLEGGAQELDALIEIPNGQVNKLAGYFEETGFVPKETTNATNLSNIIIPNGNN